MKKHNLTKQEKKASKESRDLRKGATINSKRYVWQSLEAKEA